MNEASGVASGKHPRGLTILFFTEMWERLAFYLMLGILILYSTDTERGGLGMSVSHAAEVYGTYMAFVYFTPFLGGMIADRYLGYRLAVAIGGLCMAAGFFCLGVRSETTFYMGLVAICVGNGLFKPNISAMVGNLYAPGDPKRDAGFNIFYMGINIGASLSALLSAPLRNEWSFNAAFTGAGVGLLIGVTILLLNWKRLAGADRPPQKDARDAGMGRIFATILLPAVLFGLGGYYVGQQVDLVRTTLGPITFGFLVGTLPVGFYFLTLIMRAGPEEKPGLAALIPIYIAGGAFFMILHLSGGLMTFFAEHDSNRVGEWVPAAVQPYYCQNAMPSYYRNAPSDLPRPPESALVVVGPELEAMFGARRVSETAVSDLLAQHADVKALGKDAPGFQSSWGFLVSAVYAADQMSIKTSRDEHGAETTSVSVPETVKPLREALLVRESGGKIFPVIPVSEKTKESVYKKAADARLEPGRFHSVFNAELITGFLNPFFVVLLTPLVVAYFGSRVRAGRPLSTARKLLFGMLLTSAALLFMAGGAYSGGDGATKVTLWWMVFYYLVVTTGELFLSPVGLSLVTKLAPKRLVGMMMGGWFVSTAVGNKLSGFISQLAPDTKMYVILSLAPLAVASLILMVLPMLDRAIRKYST